MRLIIATKNEGKLREIKKILKKLDVPVISLNQLSRKFRIREDGKTFLENALKKAMPVSKVYRSDYVVAEDSGLEIKYLGAEPGVYSKRYSGRGATDKKNNLKVLKELKGAKKRDRGACFHCCLVLFKDAKLVKSFDGKLRGLINEEMRGSSGFGYDPIFYLSKYRKTVAQLPLEEKNKISHRAKAFKKLRKYLINKSI
ncbi:MAG: RdgB/HAM1 family non-canonical purine NTP pyrophosphatase [Candidatus Omnitrophota bacterium]|nr:MAG: RdgB/HAM1 family non-canonical purine NTP pyrophosphatase [Candidatus Omnitrophota bacterium]